MADSDRLSRRQQRTLEALLSEPTIAEAAQQAGVSERTVYRWLADAAFAAAYQQARARLVEVAIGRLQQAAAAAVSTLTDIMQGRGHPAAARVRASIAILDMAIRGTEGEELARRLQALEAYLGGSDDPHG